MKIEELTIGEARQISALLTGQQSVQHPYKIGANYFVCTVTKYFTGRLVEVGEKELVLEDTAWIADTGRLTQALGTGNFNEVEMYPKGGRVIIGRGSLIDATEISTIPSSQK